MADQPDTENNKEPAKIDPPPTGKAKPPVNPTGEPPPTSPIISESNIGSELATQKPENKTGRPREILVRILEDDELRPFESKTLSWARWNFILAIITLGVGIVTLLIFYRQLDVMETQLKDAETDSRISDLRTRQQQQTAQFQVDAIKKQMRQDQRAWLNIQASWEI